jgi:hypothetical protein
MREYAPKNSKSMVPVSSPGTELQSASDADHAGQAIIALVQDAAEIAQDKCDRAVEVVRKLSAQIHAAEDRARQLEADVAHYQDRASRAEKWLVRVYNEIQNNFFQESPAVAPDRRGGQAN